jgi:hypothetical protein
MTCVSIWNIADLFWIDPEVTPEKASESKLACREPGRPI